MKLNRIYRYFDEFLYEYGDFAFVSAIIGVATLIVGVFYMMARYATWMFWVLFIVFLIIVLRNTVKFIVYIRKRIKEDKERRKTNETIQRSN